VVYIVVSARRRPGRETPEELRRTPATEVLATEDELVAEHGLKDEAGADVAAPDAGLDSGDQAAPSSNEPALESQDRRAD
ncbi:MAG: hypothetical protein ACRD0W_20630, partial [Acidimicrobiales bacterium]